MQHLESRRTCGFSLHFIFICREGNNSEREIKSDSGDRSRNVFRRRISNVRAGLVRSRRNIMSIFHNQQSDEIELSGKTPDIE